MWFIQLMYPQRTKSDVIVMTLLTLAMTLASWHALARALRSGELTPLYVPGMCLNGRRWKPVHWFGRGELW